MKMTDPNILSITQTLILSNKNKNNKITKKSSSVTFDHRLFCHVVGKPYEAGNPCFLLASIRKTLGTLHYPMHYTK